MRTFSFPSKTSPGKPPHVTTRHEDGSITCSCKGYYHPEHCWHYKTVRSLYPFGDEKWAELLLMMRENRHTDLLNAILAEYPAMTREELPKLIHTLCEWVCPLCNSMGESPVMMGCSKCSGGDD